MKQITIWLTAALTLLLLSGCSSKTAQSQHYSQLYKETPKKVMVVVHGQDTVPAELVQAFDKEVPAVVAELGFDIVDVQHRQLTEVPAITEVDAVLYVDIQRWNKDYSSVIAARSAVELEFKLMSAKSDQELWSHKDKYERTHLYLGWDLMSELINRTFFEVSNQYGNRASAVTKQAFSDFPEVLAAHH